MKVYENSNINSTKAFYPLLQVKNLDWQRLNCIFYDLIVASRDVSLVEVGRSATRAFFNFTLIYACGCI